MKDDSNALRHRAVEPIDTQKVERIKKLMRFYNLSQTQLADRLEINQPNLSAILSGKRPCRKNMDAKFLEAFPEVSKAWLLTGEGDMLRDDYTSFGPVAAPAPSSVDAPVSGPEMLITELRGQIKYLREQLAERDRQLNNLINKIEK